MTTFLRGGPLFVFIFGLFLAGCQTASERPLTVSARQDLLRVGVATDYPPVIFRQDSAISGVEADFARRLAETIGRRLEFVDIERDKLIDALLDNRIDIIMAGMSITRERQVRVEFCRPYLKVGQMALMRRADSAKYDSVPAILMTDGRIGTQRGTTGEQVVQQQFTKAKKVIYSSARDAALELARRRIDLVIDDAPVVWWLASEKDSELTVFPTPFTEEFLAWAVRRDDQQLLKTANDILVKWDQDGTLDRVFARWIPYMK